MCDSQLLQPIAEVDTSLITKLNFLGGVRSNRKKSAQHNLQRMAEAADDSNAGSVPITEDDPFLAPPGDQAILSPGSLS